MRLFVQRSESVLKSASSYSIMAETSYIYICPTCESISENQMKITITFERYKIG